MNLPKDIRIRDINKKIDIFIPSKDIFISLNNAESNIFRELFMKKKDYKSKYKNTKKFEDFLEAISKAIF